MTAQQLCEQLRTCKKRIYAQTELIARLRDECNSTKSVACVGTQREREDRVQGTLVLISQKEQEVDELIDQALQLQQLFRLRCECLTEEQKTILRLRYELGYKWDEIAKCMGISTRCLHVHAKNCFDKMDNKNNLS